MSGVQGELSTDDKHYKNTIAIGCAGTNACRKSEMDIEMINENLSTLLLWAQSKVVCPNDVMVSSIHPHSHR